MSRTIIHVNQHIIKNNVKNNACQPVLTIKKGKNNTYAHEAHILDKDGNIVAKVVYSPDNPLSCGARVWVESYHGVKLYVKDKEVGKV